MRLFPYFFLTTLLFLVNISSSNACSCAGERSFCEEINDSSDGTDHPTRILKAVKLVDTLHGMIIRPIQNYIGSGNLEELLVWGDNGILCRLYTSNIPNGDTLIIGISEVVSDWIPEENVGDWKLSICGVSYLPVRNKVVYGPITLTTNEMPLADFDNYMINEEYLNNCPLLNATNDLIDPDKIVMAPNPARDQFTIDIKTSDLALESIRLVNIQGHVLEEQKSLGHLSESNVNMEIGHLPNGVYLIQLRFDRGILTKKLLVQHD